MDITFIANKVSYAKIDALVLDASLEESHSFNSKVSQYPVEDGSTISDNIYNEPDSISIHGIISNHPLQTSPNYNTSMSDNARSAFTYLTRLRDERRTISVYTNYKKYDDMAMQSLTVNDNYKIGDSLQFTARFVHVKKVSSSSVPKTYLSSKQGMNKKAAPQVDVGKTTPAPVEPKKESFLLKVFNGILEGAAFVGGAG